LYEIASKIWSTSFGSRTVTSTGWELRRLSSDFPADVICARYSSKIFHSGKSAFEAL
jgi:hypothetical protein